MSNLGFPTKTCIRANHVADMQPFHTCVNNQDKSRETGHALRSRIIFLGGLLGGSVI